MGAGSERSDSGQIGLSTAYERERASVKERNRSSQDSILHLGCSSRTVHVLGPSAWLGLATGCHDKTVGSYDNDAEEFNQRTQMVTQPVAACLFSNERGSVDVGLTWGLLL